MFKLYSVNSKVALKMKKYKLCVFILLKTGFLKVCFYYCAMREIAARKQRRQISFRSWGA
jgi:hypothetical protein